MRKSILFLICLLLLCSTVFANPGRSQLVYTIPEYSVYLDTVLIAPVDKQTIDFVVEYRFTPEGKEKYIDSLKRSGTYSEELKNFTRLSVNYQTKLDAPYFRTGLMIFTDQNGKVLKSFPADFDQWKSYLPGSYEEQICIAAKNVILKK